MLARCCMPPESSRGNFFSNPARPTSSSSPAMRALIWLRVDLLDLERKQDVLQFRQGRRFASWKIMPISGRGSGDGRAVEDDLAAVSSCRPERPQSSVVLPHPDGPGIADEFALWRSRARDPLGRGPSPGLVL